MNIKLYSSKCGELPLQKKTLKEWKNLSFPGAETIASISDALGYFYAIQQFETPFFYIRYCCFYSFRKDVLTIKTDETGMVFRLGIDYTHSVTSDGLGSQIFHKCHCNCFYEPDGSLYYPINPFERYIFLDILPNPDYCYYLRYYFPETKQFFGKIAQGVSARLAQQNLIAQAEIWRWQVELQEWCYQENKNMNRGNIIANNLIECNIRALNYAPQSGGINLPRSMINKVYKAAEIIEDNGAFSLDELSSIVGLSPLKLNEGFKEIFGHGPAEHRFEDKMLQALRLLDCSDGNSERVAMLLEYKDTDQFIRDFTRRFGYAPHQKPQVSL